MKEKRKKEKDVKSSANPFSGVEFLSQPENLSSFEMWNRAKKDPKMRSMKHKLKQLTFLRLWRLATIYRKRRIFWRSLRRFNVTLFLMFCNHLTLKGSEWYPVWPHLAIYWTLGDFLNPLAKFNLPKSPTFLGNFCKGFKIYYFF